MFKTRLISGIILVLIALAVIVPGGNTLLLALAMISFLGLNEFYRVFEIEKALPGMIGYAAGIGYYVFLWLCVGRQMKEEAVFGSAFLGSLSGSEVFAGGILLFLVLLMFAYVFGFPKWKTEQIIAAFFGLFYVEVMLSFVYLTRMLPLGKYLVWLIFLCSWGCDTCAYCVGVLFGKHKMSPKLSPKKSIEGAVGGVVGAAALGAIYGAVIGHYVNTEVVLLGLPGSFAILCAVGGLISMVGDLAASAIKRDHEIKDYGNLIPGHGGILDRFDSVIFTAPIVYFLAKAFLG